MPYLILDGKVVDTDRCREAVSRGRGHRFVVRGKTHDFGGNIQAVYRRGCYGFLMCCRAMFLTWPRPGEVLGVLRPFWTPCLCWPSGL